MNLNISYPFQYKWYSVFANVNTNYTKYKGSFGGGNRVINLDMLAFNIYMQNTFILGKGYTAEISGFYTSPSVWEGTFTSIAMGGLDAGFQKTVLKTKGNIKLSVSNIFRTMQWGGHQQFCRTIYLCKRWLGKQTV